MSCLFYNIYKYYKNNTSTIWYRFISRLTDDNFIFRKFTLLSAISNKKCIGWILYEKGGSTKERFVEFLQNNIFQKYKNHLLILDNARAHNNNLVKQAIIDSGNKYLFTAIHAENQCNWNVV